MPRHKFPAVGSQDFEDSSPEGAASVSMNFRSAATRNIVQPTEAPEGNGVARKRRPNLRPEAKAVLTAWLTEHRHHPYPTEEEKDALVCEAGVTLAQVCNWFINARRRQLPGMLQQEGCSPENYTITRMGNPKSKQSPPGTGDFQPCWPIASPKSES
ncbi:homeobox protein AKR-like [Hyalella azteca]|uniref:Homeobox protein AKR-like n=1 Tax=Hyalella azteca TaxID=294128 RepID=A0A8B7MY73_HYAAZ|nr:homeobox protein AKR-like [Hyalella azteca]